MALSFHIGKIPVRIVSSFFLMTVLINFGLLESEPQKLAVWAAIVLVSVLLHELGHAATCLAFGLAPSIDLHGMGGTTSWSTSRHLSTARRVAISLAGPGAGFVAGAAVLLAVRALGPAAVPPRGLAAFAYESLLYVNVGWGLLNLLPMLPLDGGTAMTHLLNASIHGRGERPALIVSIVVAGASTLLALRYFSFWPALLALSFMVSNWRGLRSLSDREQRLRIGRRATRRLIAAFRSAHGTSAAAATRRPCSPRSGPPPGRRHRGARARSPRGATEGRRISSPSSRPRAMTRSVPPGATKAARRSTAVARTD